LNEFLRRSADGQAIAGHLTDQAQISVLDLAKKIDVPTLAIHGQEDQVVPLEWGRELASVIPGARLEILQEWGHNVWLSSRCRELIAEFLAEDR
jgi:pimeloyl-ACP methyl ester carboxylesterase